MSVVSMTKAGKESIARSVAKEILSPPLHEHWKEVVANLDGLVCGFFGDFDWEHVEPYREFINWHRGIRMPVLSAGWMIDREEFSNVCALPSVQQIELSIEYPSKSEYIELLPFELSETAKSILGPYMDRYFEAKKHYEDIKQALQMINAYEQFEDLIPELVKRIPGTTAADFTALEPLERISWIKNSLRKEEK